MSTNALIAHVENYREQIANRFQRVTNGDESTSKIPTASTSSIDAVKKETIRINQWKSFEDRIRFDKVVVSFEGFNAKCDIDFEFFYLSHSTMDFFNNWKRHRIYCNSMKMKDCSLMAAKSFR